ncbi:uncharacterized protein LOC131433733 [Malaya genurostris]|uniref:uncharacterized protein LOC131433733 n=1 Tax=Malaya genurostris TaxID=325434 RepID=UPI0026F39689|nr:uncharacterized protein LOC131433733 [Malaya genurostris]
MNSLFLQISSLSIFFGHCDAVPVPSRHFGERNAALLGVLTCIGIGAVFGMCVFCKKKKGHFKKFENDGNIEEVKNSEYPVLNSLSIADVKKTGVIIPSSPTNLSTDNLLDQAAQYQNESVSSHELDGIENYNLLQYRSQILTTAKDAHYVGKCIVQNDNIQLPPERDDEECNSNMLLSSKESLSSLSPFPGTSIDYSNGQEVVSLVNSNDFDDDKLLIDHHSNGAEPDIEEVDNYCQLDIEIQNPVQLDDVKISVEKKGSFCEKIISKSATTNKYCAAEDVTPMDSLEDNFSVHETNSIEEALRALDFAIDGEDESSYSDDEPNRYPGCDGGKFDNRGDVYPGEFYENKNSSSDSGMEETEISEKNAKSDPALLETVRKEASQLVDEVLFLCQRRIEAILECEKRVQMENKVTIDEFDDFNSGSQLECSTPFVSRKILEYDSKPEVRHNLFYGENNKTFVMSDNVIQTKESRDNSKCFSKTNVTYLADPAEVDDDLEQIYPIHDIVTPSSANLTHTLANSSETFIKDQDDSLPEIMVHGMLDDVLSDKPTATPMNTPIELGCPTTADWDRWLSATASVAFVPRDLHAENDYFSNHTYDEGWFLHTRPSCTSAHNETYDLEDNDNLDSTYDMLRKQLAEMLPHAQGAKENTEYQEESDTSPDHFGIQYGDLDEATNEPSGSAAKDNEIIINYKRTLSPIMEESEDESFYNRTSCYKETSNYVESTSTSCMESFTAMGLNKTLMASNDTLFNFEDVLDEILSPRVPSQSHTPTNRDREYSDYFVRSPRHETPFELISTVDLYDTPRTLDLATQRVRDFSLSSPGDPTRVDFSQDSSFTLEEKTCISIRRPNEDDERISEISEPCLVSSTSYCNKQEDNNSLMDEEIVSLEEDSFNEILNKEKPIESEQYDHVLGLQYSTETMLNMQPPEPDENFDPASNLSNPEHDAVYLHNKLNMENTYNNRNLEEQVVIESIDRFLLKSRNISLPEDKSTNPLVNGHLNNGKVSCRSDGNTICINYEK